MCYFYNISAVPRSGGRRIIFYDAPVVLNDVMCTGNEESILNCTETGYGIFDDCTIVAVAQCEGEFALNSGSKMYVNFSTITAIHHSKAALSIDFTPYVGGICA